jgi:hypothetical protein
MLRIAQRSAETHVPFYFPVTQSQMSANTVKIVDLCVACNLRVPAGTRLTLGSLDYGIPEYVDVVAFAAGPFETVTTGR